MFWLFLGLLTAFAFLRCCSKLRLLVLGMSWMIAFFYAFWRITVIPFHHGWWSFFFGMLLFIAEMLGLITFLIFQYLFSCTYRPTQKGLDVFEKEGFPSVDVLICTYNEPLYLLEMTIAASMNLDYPKDRLNVYVCDDGHRTQLEKLCMRYGAHYLTREDNQGAKAGNINHALTKIKGDLFAVFDADMIPKRSFLTRTAGYFHDEQMAFVQTPQVYYNQDVYQYHLQKHMPNEQDFFMREIQTARASKGAVLHVGTNALFRRSMVMEIGGYPTCSITEDMAVGMLLQEKGYGSMLINEELVFGLSATTLPELIKQRDRWCRGNLQVLRHFNPFFSKGLSFAQKVAYVDGVLYWFCNLQKLVFILCPLLFFLFDFMLLDTTLEQLLYHFVPYAGAQLVVNRCLSAKTRRMRWGHYYEMVMAPYLSFSILKELFHVKAKFNVTSKEVTQERHVFQYALIWPHLFLLILTLAAWMIAVWRWQQGQLLFSAFMINLFWSAYNLSGMIIAIRAAWQKPIFRKTERLSFSEEPVIKLISKKGNVEGSITDLSGQGCRIRLMQKKPFEINGILFIKWQDHVLPCKVVRHEHDALAVCFFELNPVQFRFIMDQFCALLSTYYDVGKKQEYAVEDVKPS